MPYVRALLRGLLLAVLAVSSVAEARVPTSRGIPALAANGHLPPGMHLSGYAELAQRFGSSTRRKALLSRMRRAFTDLRKSGVARVYVGGSFVSSKVDPNDVDLLVPRARAIDWDRMVEVARREAPRGLHFYGARKIVTDALSMKQLTEAQRNAWTLRKPDFVEFFGQNRRGEQVGLVAVDLSSLASP